MRERVLTACYSLLLYCESIKCAACMQSLQTLGHKQTKKKLISQEWHIIARLWRLFMIRFFPGSFICYCMRGVGDSLGSQIVRVCVCFPMHLCWLLNTWAHVHIHPVINVLVFVCCVFITYAKIMRVWHTSHNHTITHAHKHTYIFYALAKISFVCVCCVTPSSTPHTITSSHTHAHKHTYSFYALAKIRLCVCCVTPNSTPHTITPSHTHAHKHTYSFYAVAKIRLCVCCVTPNSTPHTITPSHMHAHKHTCRFYALAAKIRFLCVCCETPNRMLSATRVKQPKLKRVTRKRKRAWLPRTPLVSCSSCKQVCCRIKDGCFMIN